MSNSRSQINSNFYQIANTDATCGNVTGINIGNVSATGNITAAYYFGNGSGLTGVTATSAYGNSNVSTYLASNSAVTILTTGNITTAANIAGAYITGNGAFLTGLSAGYSNADVANYLQVLTTNVTTTANVQASYLIGNIRNTTGGYNDANVAAYLPTYTGNLQSGNLLVINSVVIQGNLQVQGNTTYINSNVVNIDDKDIVIANGATTASQANGAGLIVGQGNLANIIFNNPANAWTLYPGVSTPGNVSGSYLLGNGYFITDIQYSNLVGAYSNANVANYLPIYTGNLQAGNAAILGNITANVMQFNTAANQTATTGSMTWNATEETVDLALNTDVTLQLGQEFVYRVIANGAISNGQIVMFSGVQGDQVVARVANTAAPGFNSTYVIGMATQDIADTATGFVTSEGKVRDVNTGSFVVGDILWLAPNTAGLMSNTKPAAGNARVQVAAVLKTSPGNGGIYQVRVTREPALSDLENVADTAAANDFLVYNGNIWTSEQLDISLDTTPMLGGNLSGQGYDITTTGNITGAYFLGNGSQLTGLPATYGNANVANYLPTYTGDIGAGNITVTETVSANNIVATEDVSSNTMFAATLLTVGGNLIGGDADFGGNVIVGADVIVTGNITGNNFNGDVYSNLIYTNVIRNGNTDYLTISGLERIILSSQDTINNGTANLVMNGGYGFELLTINTANTQRTWDFVDSGLTFFPSTLRLGNFSTGVTYTSTRGNTGEILTTYSNGVTYWSSATSTAESFNPFLLAGM